MGTPAKADYRARDEYRIVSADGKLAYGKPSLQAAVEAARKANSDIQSIASAAIYRVAEHPYRVETRHVGAWSQVPVSRGPERPGGEAGQGPLDAAETTA